MSYADVLDGLHARFQTIAGLTVIKGEPASIQTNKILYSDFMGCTREHVGTTVRVTYRSRHRLCIKWGERENVEEQLAELVNAVPIAIESSPHLGGQTRGQATITTGEPGWVTIGQTDCRSCDFVSEVLEVGPVGTL